jgi:hypothetical protein
MKSFEYEAKANNLLEAGLVGAAQVYATLALMRAVKESQNDKVLLK